MKNKLDKWDTAISVSSAIVTAACDFFFVEDIDLKKAHEWGVEKADEFVMNVSKKCGYKGDDISGAIKHLEDKYHMAGDELTNEFGGGTAHHLRDFSHHPSPIGLAFSILTQITGKCYGTDTRGAFVCFDVPNWQEKDFVSGIYMGVISWGMHLISDMAGSSGTRKGSGEGTGLPGIIMSLLKEVSSIPGIRSIAGVTDKNTPNKESNYNFSVICSKMFNGTLFAEHGSDEKIVKGTQIPFDLRTEIGIVNESINNKQYLPVMFNNIIVAAGYSIRRFVKQIEFNNCKTFEDLEKIDIKICLPYRKNDVFRHMKMIGAVTFSGIDITSSGIKAAMKNKNNRQGFALDFVQGINYWGLGDLALSTNLEVLSAVEKMKEDFDALIEKQKRELIDRLPNGEEYYRTGKYVVEQAMAIAEIGTPIGYASAAIGVYDAIKEANKDLKEATERRIRIEKECEERIAIIKENRAIMEETISDYFYSRITVFVNAFDTMDRAITNNDIDEFIMGNNMIQNNLDGETKFNNIKEFDDMMLSEDSIKF